MNPLANNSGWPHYGRGDNDHGASVFTIAAYLEILGLKRLTNNFLLWLAHYEGLEQHLAEDDDPVTNVRNVLAKFVIERRRCDAGNAEEVKKLVQDITHELMKLDFIHRKAFWGDEPMQPTGGKKLWNPTRQSWLSFIEHHEPGQEIWLWRGDEPHITESLLQTILLGDE